VLDEQSMTIDTANVRGLICRDILGGNSKVGKIHRKGDGRFHPTTLFQTQHSKTKPHTWECYASFGCETKMGVIPILAIFQDKSR